MSKKTVRNIVKPVHKETPLVVWIWMMGVGLLSYVVARMVLYSSPHPFHWLSAAGGGMAGYLVGWLWYRWKGDVI